MKFVYVATRTTFPSLSSLSFRHRLGISQHALKSCPDDQLRDYSSLRDGKTIILLMAEILHHLIRSLSHYLKGFIHPRWCRISSINRINPYSLYSYAVTGFRNNHAKIDWNWSFYGDFLSEFETWVFQMPLVQYLKNAQHVCSLQKKQLPPEVCDHSATFGYLYNFIITRGVPLLWCGFINLTTCRSVSPVGTFRVRNRWEKTMASCSKKDPNSCI